MSQPLPGGGPVFDLVGVGFGPSNLAMAIAVAEHNRPDRADRVTATFLERQPTFGWHRGMLIDDATMQVSFLKDLVTLRNPVSDFSFLCYLQERGRLLDFINHKTLFPLRAEFHDYFTWAAARVAEAVRYDTEVVSVQPVRGTGDDIVALDVVSRRGGTLVTHRTRNLVVGTGLRPKMPAGIERPGHIWHNCDLLHKVDALRGTAPRRFVVVGAGQSGAETVAYLHREFPTAEVCAVFSRYGYSPADDSSFANRIFDPAAVDDYYTAPEHTKQRLTNYHANTNYSVVDTELIDELYRRAYQEQVAGRQRLRLLNVTRLTGATDTGDGVRVEVDSLVTGETSTLEADVLICATGYDAADPYGLLGPVADHCLRDEIGRPRVTRDYRAVTTPDLRCGIYLQGGTEHTHGITSSLLSNTAIRVGEILGSVLAHRAEPALVVA
jgi:L-ornithine N5-oxygenase